jgi:hypothetical protein
MAILAAAAVGAYFVNRLNPEFRGEPLFLFFGVVLWASWAVVVLLTAYFRGRDGTAWAALASRSSSRCSDSSWRRLGSTDAHPDSGKAWAER